LNPGPLTVAVMEPEWLHSIWNTDDHTYHVIRIEFKAVDATQYHWPFGELLGR